MALDNSRRAKFAEHVFAFESLVALEEPHASALATPPLSAAALATPILSAAALATQPGAVAALSQLQPSPLQSSSPQSSQPLPPLSSPAAH